MGRLCLTPRILQDAYDINQLRHPELFSPRAKPPVRRDAPLSSATPPGPRKLPSSPSDIEDFINEVRTGPGPPLHPAPRRG